MTVPSLEVARDLLGAVVSRSTGDGTVRLRLTEVEAYAGEIDPASHAYRGQTRRNVTMFGPPGHAYVYFTYGMHYCVNLVCSPPGEATAVLLRAGEVTAGLELARSRRPRMSDRDLARGPARLTQALALNLSDDGLDVCGGTGLIVGPGEPVPDEAVRTGPAGGRVRRERPSHGGSGSTVTHRSASIGRPSPVVDDKPVGRSSRTWDHRGVSAAPARDSGPDPSPDEADRRAGVIDELTWRGQLAQSTDLGALAAALRAGPGHVLCRVRSRPQTRCTSATWFR